MNIETGQVRQRPRCFSGEEPAAILELSQNAHLQLTSDVRYKLIAQRFDAELLVRGALEVDVRGRCARCGEEIEQTIREGSFACSYPLGSDNELIDLTTDIREAILLAFPINLVCSAACRGLCLQCGANLNKASCSCAGPRHAFPWGMLDQLTIARK